jgi:hypothetical protein
LTYIAFRGSSFQKVWNTCNGYCKVAKLERDRRWHLHPSRRLHDTETRVEPSTLAHFGFWGLNSQKNWLSCFTNSRLTKYRNGQDRRSRGETRSGWSPRRWYFRFRGLQSRKTWRAYIAESWNEKRCLVCLACGRDPWSHGGGHRHSTFKTRLTVSLSRETRKGT